MQNGITLVQEQPRGSSILVEIPIVAGTQRQNLPDVQQLRSQEGQVIIIKAIRLITPKVLTNAITLAGTNAPVTELRKIALTLYCEGWEKGKYIPLLVLNDVADSDAAVATTIPFRNVATKLDNWRNVDWAQSYIQFGNGVAPAGAPYIIMLEVEYEKLNAKGVPIIGPS
jgi:hypothetical protein